MTFCNLHGEEGRRQRGVWDLKSYEAVLYSNHVLAFEASTSEIQRWQSSGIR